MSDVADDGGNDEEESHPQAPPHVLEGWREGRRGGGVDRVILISA